MIKFGRNYILRITTDSGSVTIEPPFTVEFDITRNTLSSVNVAQFRIYNLAEITRNQIRHNACDYGNYKRVTFTAGYGNNMASVFKGNITSAFSSREGVDFITTIESYDGGYGYANGEVNLTFSPGTPIKAVITAIAKTLSSKHISIGAIGDYPGVLTKGVTFTGSTMDRLTELTSGGAFIDNEKFYALGTNEYVLSLKNTAVINTQSGLLGTPELEGGTTGKYTVRFDMLFEPGLITGHKITLDSQTARDINVSSAGKTSLIGPAFNGDYIVKAVKHRGVISGAVCGNAVTTGTFFFAKNPVGVGGA